MCWLMYSGENVGHLIRDRMKYSRKVGQRTYGNGGKLWLLLLLCGNAHQRISSKEALLNNLGRITWTDDVCRPVISHPVLTYRHIIGGAQVTVKEVMDRPQRRCFCSPNLISPLLMMNIQCASKRLTRPVLPVEHHSSRKRTRHLELTIMYLLYP